MRFESFLGFSLEGFAHANNYVNGYLSVALGVICIAVAFKPASHYIINGWFCVGQACLISGLMTCYGYYQMRKQNCTENRVLYAKYYWYGQLIGWWFGGYFFFFLNCLGAVKLKNTTEVVIYPSTASPALLALLIVAASTLYGYFAYCCLMSYSDGYTIVEEDVAGWVSQREIYPGTEKVDIQASGWGSEGTSVSQTQNQVPWYEQQPMPDEEPEAPEPLSASKLAWYE